MNPRACRFIHPFALSLSKGAPLNPEIGRPAADRQSRTRGSNLQKRNPEITCPKASL